ncbi:hypothetical protein JM80_0728 [Cellulophaga sp. RHA_52]|uniref:hypothetical protein n=1 Tax=Cellulophaga sp. RHA_52 TaxID=1250036 RepID=UPI00119B395C|nr:hypothetical protein [Cellulophaga sp. RHA_52]TVZ08244.1 hypothetical protein JM80_0728 [Cellulophaga sp. RHA_52]
MLSRKLFLSLYVIAILAFFTLSYSSFYSNFFEFFLIVLVLINLRTINKSVILLLLSSTVYLVTSLVYSVAYNQANILDFLLIYKFFVYAILLSLLVNKKNLNQVDFVSFYNFLLWVFLIKYITSIVFFGNNRPIVFYENNYELMLLSLLFYLKNIVVQEGVSVKDQVFLSTIFILSGSKSGILILLFMLSIINYKYLAKKAHIIVPFVFVLTITAIFIFKQRMGGTFDIEKIDRFKFLMVFLSEVEDWSILDFLIGADRITSLSSFACGKLGYYQSLFSYSGDGSCYSVIFHSFILRVIYDHGIFGLLFMCYFVYKILKVSGFTKKQCYTVLGIALLNGLSVSSFNSIYFVLGVVFYLTINNKQANILKREHYAVN